MNRRELLKNAAGLAAGVAAIGVKAEGQAVNTAGGGAVSLPVELKSATSILKMIADGEIGSVELLDMLLERCDKFNPSLNAVIAFDIKGARDAAREADNLSRRKRGPLHGLPMTIKDVYEVTGMTASCGFPHLADHRPEKDADAVAKLRMAGVIPFGKTNTPLAASDHQSYNQLYGTSNNPWDVTRTPGGSSGGAAAAVAAGLSPLELGSDIGGSIRCPAHFCGIYGHKPSFGIVSTRGHIPPMPGELSPKRLSVSGPMARSAADLELALDILAGPSELDGTAWSVLIPESRHESLQDFRVALWADKSAYSIDSRCLDAIHAYADELRKLGVTVDEKARPDLDPEASDDLYVAMLFSIISADMPEEDIRQIINAAADDKLDDRSYEVRIARAVQLSFSEYVQLEKRQLQLFQVWRKFFGEYDLIMCPCMPTVAFPHDHSGEGPGHIAQYSRTVMVDGEPVPYMNGLQWPGLVTIAHLPATAVPTGRKIDGMPMGLQIVGPYLEDRTILRFAQLVERELGGYQVPPIA